MITMKNTLSVTLFLLIASFATAQVPCTLTASAKQPQVADWPQL